MEIRIPKEIKNNENRVGLGAYVTVLDVNKKRLRYVKDIMPSQVVTEFSNEYNIRKHIKNHDFIIGGVLIKCAKAPKLIT